MTQTETETETEAEPTVTLADMLATGATYRQVDYWCRRGYLTPEFPRTGSGHNRLWSERDRRVCEMIVHLSAIVATREAVNMARLAVDEGVTGVDVGGGIRIEWGDRT